MEAQPCRNSAEGQPSKQEMQLHQGRLKLTNALAPSSLHSCTLICTREILHLHRANSTMLISYLLYQAETFSPLLCWEGGGGVHKRLCLSSLFSLSFSLVLQQRCKLQARISVQSRRGLQKGLARGCSWIAPLGCGAEIAVLSAPCNRFPALAVAAEIPGSAPT